jgi:quinoprotein glucose dehydrogenase
VVALDAVTGEMLWMHSQHEGERGQAAPRQLSGRGLSYWTDGEEERILYVTPGYRLVSLDARTGHPVASFGRNGVVDLKQDFDQEIDLVTAPVGLHSTPLVAGDVVVVGASFETGANPRSKANVKGHIRGFDVRTGKRLWIFHTIPRPGEFGNDTWLDDSWAYTGNTGVWARISSSGSRTCPSKCPRTTTTVVSVPATTYSAKASWPSTCEPASGSGTTSWCTTESGIWTFPRRRSWLTSP